MSVKELMPKPSQLLHPRRQVRRLHRMRSMPGLNAITGEVKKVHRIDLEKMHQVRSLHGEMQIRRHSQLSPLNVKEEKMSTPCKRQDKQYAISVSQRADHTAGLQRDQHEGPNLCLSQGDKRDRRLQDMRSRSKGSKKPRSIMRASRSQKEWRYSHIQKESNTKLTLELILSTHGPKLPPHA